MKKVSSEGGGRWEEEVWGGGGGLREWGRDRERHTGKCRKMNSPLCKMTVPVLSADLTCYAAPRGGCRGRTHTLTQTFRHTQLQTQGIQDLGTTEIREPHHASDLTVDAFPTLNECWQKQRALDFELSRPCVGDITGRPSTGLNNTLAPFANKE